MEQRDRAVNQTQNKLDVNFTRKQCSVVPVFPDRRAANLFFSQALKPCLSTNTATKTQ